VGYLIENNDGSGLPLYYNPKVGRDNGSGILGWTQEKQRGLAFARKEDAQVFIEAILPQQEGSCRPVAVNLAD
jgi:hypothetical protein